MDYQEVQEKCKAIEQQIKDAVVAIGGNMDSNTNGGVHVSLNVDSYRSPRLRFSHKGNIYGKNFFATVGSYGKKKMFKEDPLPIAEIAQYIKEYIEQQKVVVAGENAREETRKANEKTADELKAKYGLHYGVVEGKVDGLQLHFTQLTPANAEFLLKCLMENPVSGNIVNPLCKYKN
jgi:hypothetical protein